VGKRISTVYYLLTKEIGTYTQFVVAFGGMPTSILTGAKNKQVIKINIPNQKQLNYNTNK